MQAGRPSFTAAAVAFARGVAGVDPVASSLVDGPLAWLVRAGGAPAFHGMPPAVNLATLGLIDHIDLRTRAIDAAVDDAARGGTRQLVLLGAGLDARAWRMPELAGVTVFEVDYPSTQAYKRARLDAAGARAARATDVRFVAVDFARDRLADALERSGHDAGTPTMWVWEGVTPYLPLEAVRSTLGDLARRSAPRSRIAVTYMQPHRSELARRLLGASRVGFHAFGEPIVGLIPRGVFHAELESAGFSVASDTKPVDWAKRFGRSPSRRLAAHFALRGRVFAERLVLAHSR
jgi:methyltransferase (TIGR00027 family)